eukprot:4408164-Pyramimonas_sp.AAC.1
MRSCPDGQRSESVGDHASHLRGPLHGRHGLQRALGNGAHPLQRIPAGPAQRWPRKPPPGRCAPSPNTRPTH